MMNDFKTLDDFKTLYKDLALTQVFDYVSLDQVATIVSDKMFQNSLPRKFY